MKFIKAWGIAVAIGLVSALAVHFAGGLSVVRGLELGSEDLRFRFRGPVEPGGDVVVVAIDDDTEAALETVWPFPRAWHAHLLRNLHRAGARVVGFDVVFDAEDRRNPEGDRLFREAIDDVSSGGTAVVLGGRLRAEAGEYGTAYQVVVPNPELRGSAAHLGFLNQPSDPDNVMRKSSLLIRNDDLGLELPAFGFVAASLFRGIDYREAISGHKEKGSRDRPVRAAFDFGGSPVPVNDFGDFAAFDINYYGPAGTVDTLLYQNVLLLEVDPDISESEVRDKIVLVGTTSSAMHDVFLTPFRGRGSTPGVEIHANAIQNLLSGKFIGRVQGKYVFVLLLLFGVFTAGVVQWSLRGASEWPAALAVLGLVFSWAFFSLVFFAGLAPYILVPYLTVVVAAVVLVKKLPGLAGRPRGAFGRVALPPVVVALAVAGVAALVAGEDRAAAYLAGAGVPVFKSLVEGVMLPMVPPILSIVLSAGMTTGYVAMTEGRGKKQVKGIFSRYVSPDVVEKLMEDPRGVALGGKKEEVTILFSDIRGFTSLSEKMPPERVVEFLNEYFSAMTAVILETRGTLDKFIGDAVMAFWNAPVAQPDHRERGVRAALKMREELARLNDRWEKEGRGYPQVNIGIGVNTGEVVVGNVGSEMRMDYTVIGDHVNLASRLEGLCKKYGVGLVVSEYTLGPVRGRVRHRMLDEVSVKGREEPVKIYEVFDFND